MSKRANKKNRKQREQRIKNNVKVDDIEKLIVSRWLQSEKEFGKK